MVIDAAVLVVDDDEGAGVPQSIILPNSVIHILNESFAVANVIIGMLVGGGERSSGWVVGRVILRLDEAVGGNIVGVIIADGGEVGIGVVEKVLVCHQTAEGERPGPVRPVDAGRNPLLGEFLVDGVDEPKWIGKLCATRV